MSRDDQAAGVAEAAAAFAGPVARAKLFAHGGSQAVRLPKAFRFKGEEVLVRRDGERVILEPPPGGVPKTPEEWSRFWAEIDDLTGGDFPDREQPPMQERDWS